VKPLLPSFSPYLPPLSTSSRLVERRRILATFFTTCKAFLKNYLNSISFSNFPMFWDSGFTAFTTLQRRACSLKEANSRTLFGAWQALSLSISQILLASLLNQLDTSVTRANFRFPTCKTMVSPAGKGLACAQ
jgi:hypothetical protein